MEWHVGGEDGGGGQRVGEDGGGEEGEYEGGTGGVGQGVEGVGGDGGCVVSGAEWGGGLSEWLRRSSMRGINGEQLVLSLNELHASSKADLRIPYSDGWSVFTHCGALQEQAPGTKADLDQRVPGS